MIEITDKIYYVGVNDRNKELFEGLWPLPNGVSYNSYLIDDEKVCLIDTVEVDFFMPYLKNIREVLGDRQIDYLVINHMEPDHSGAIELIRKYYPGVKIVANKKTFGMIEGFYGVTADEVEVKNGSTLSLGKHQLSFVLTPMVHWPETMMTFDAAEGVLFSGDAFGTFGALNGGCLDARIDTEEYWDEMVRYYSNVVGRYGQPVQKALAKLKNLPVSMICSTHGPVWVQEKDRVISLYDRWSRYEAERGVTLAYGSMYGNTERMAETIAEELSQRGIRKIRLHNLSKSDPSYILADVFRYRGLILGAPTYNATLFPAMESLLSKILNRDIKGRYLGYFGSFSWAGAAVKSLGEFAEKSRFEIVGQPVEMKQGIRDDIRRQCRELAEAMVARLDQDER